MLEAGKIYDFKVRRKTDLGFMLEKDDSLILMHYKQSDREYENGDSLKAFVYFDKEGRLCASAKSVRATTDTPGKVLVKTVTQNAVFVDINTSKDVLVSTDYLPYNKSLWPQEGEEIFVILKLKRNSLVAKVCQKTEAKTTDRPLEGVTVSSTVQMINKAGIGLLDDNLNYIFVPNMMLRGKYHLGMKVDVKITKVTEDIIYGSLILKKELQMKDDKSIIINYLKEHNGFMPFTAKSSAEEIEQAFKISRKAFKRAYGELYKERKINFDDNGTNLVVE